LKKVKSVPKDELYIALLDDDPDYSCRPDCFYSFYSRHNRLYKHGQGNLLITEDVRKFIGFANNHKNAVLFCDPGALGTDQTHGVKFKEDELMAKWLEDNPSRVLNVPHLLPVDYYSFKTFELKGNINFFGSEFQRRIHQILYEWLFEHNPMALFTGDENLASVCVQFIEKLKEPVLGEVCKNLGIKGKTASERRKAVDKYYAKIIKKGRFFGIIKA